jgi:hypothetical protein
MQTEMTRPRLQFKALPFEEELMLMQLNEVRSLQLTVERYTRVVQIFLRLDHLVNLIGLANAAAITSDNVDMRIIAFKEQTDALVIEEWLEGL